VELKHYSRKLEIKQENKVAHVLARDILKFNHIFAGLMQDDSMLASLSKFNPEARELFDSGVFRTQDPFRNLVESASVRKKNRNFWPSKKKESENVTYIVNYGSYSHLHYLKKNTQEALPYLLNYGINSLIIASISEPTKLTTTPTLAIIAFALL
jgi:hypothetical protein